ncbi:acyl-CoA dehydrogenase family protein [Pseudonocardia nigra]|uniref:acyl-CoA dehydrogenase family protein n=1 Tax=Pseudonocardia nigra TaxID=1921578 RepID=UPI0027E27D0B|nr:acyl-CoA dehydrogenase family protein [Pseudonocardia nigra]
MDLVFSPEQEQLRASVRRFLAEKSPLSSVRALMDDPTGHDPAVWRQMAEQLGLQGLAIPEKFGGSGFGFVELAVVQEELGRALLPSPFTATVVLAAHALLDASDPAAAEDLLPGIADGSTIATLAVSLRWDPESPALTAERSVEGWVLHGSVGQVPDGHVAGLVLAAARTPAGPSLFAIDAASGAPGLTRTPLPTLDQTARLARLDLEGVPARLVGTEGAAGTTLRRTLDRAAVALAVEQVGGAQRALEMAVEYAKVRHQFDRPIGSFQAIKHKAADVMLQVESARAVARYATWAVARDSAEVPAVASLAKAYCSDAYFAAAAENIQIHGGIGFTWEHDAHLYFKRAAATRLFLGDPTFHRERLAVAIGL